MYSVYAVICKVHILKFEHYRCRYYIPHFAVYSGCTVYAVRTVYTRVYSVQHEMYIVHCTMNNVHCAVQLCCTMYIVLHYCTSYRCWNDFLNFSLTHEWFSFHRLRFPRFCKYDTGRKNTIFLYFYYVKIQ